MDGLTPYQRMRQAFLGENVQFLAEYGFEAPVVETTSVTLVEKENKRPVSARKRVKPATPVERRTSGRLRRRVNPDYFEEFEELPDSDEDKPKKVKRPQNSYDIDEDQLKNLREPAQVPIPKNRKNTYGAPTEDGVRVGSWWWTRMDCSRDGVHRPPVSGIYYTSDGDGAYSVALSGGYEDDVDYGDSFTYTGEGGRDLTGTKANPKNLRTAPQSKDQQLTGGNEALSKNVDTGNPVRVIRGYKLKSKFAPSHGYRYDGLYKVTKCWKEKGKSGYIVFKFSFERCDPEPAPWCNEPKQILPIQDEDSLKERGSQDCPPVSIPEANILTLWYEDVKQKVMLTGDRWHSLELKICAETSPFEHEAILQDIGWHGWPSVSDPETSTVC